MLTLVLPAIQNMPRPGSGPGSEVAGEVRAIAQGAVLIYEDHGMDAACTVSAHLVRDPDMRLFAMEGGLVPVAGLTAIAARKTDPFRGYNFLAARAESPLLATLRARM